MRLRRIAGLFMKQSRNLYSRKMNIVRRRTACLSLARLVSTDLPLPSASAPSCMSYLLRFREQTVDRRLGSNN